MQRFKCHVNLKLSKKKLMETKFVIQLSYKLCLKLSHNNDSAVIEQRTIIRLILN